MTPEQLLHEWEADGEDDSPGMRPKRVQVLRDELMAATGEYIPTRLPQIEAMLTNHPQKRGVITRKLREAVDATEGPDE